MKCVRCFACFTLTLLVITAPASAAVTTAGPFVGDYHDNFDQYWPNVNAVQELDVFDHHGVIRNLTSGGAIKIELGSELNGDLVLPINKTMMGQLGIADWVFNQPVSRFGGMWENNSHADDATVTFFDSNNNLLGTQIANVPTNGQTWVWNGWQSDVPIKRIHVVGNGIINGFIWYENMEMSVAVPEPAGCIACISIAVSLMRRGQRLSN